jgi:hypothetical protein
MLACVLPGPDMLNAQPVDVEKVIAAHNSGPQRTAVFGLSLYVASFQAVLVGRTSFDIVLGKKAGNKDGANVSASSGN